MPSVTVSRNNAWRGSTHHVSMESEVGLAILDFVHDESSETWSVTTCSFDGYGAMRGDIQNVPDSLAEYLFHDLPEGVTRPIEDGEEALIQLRQFFQSRVEHIPERWHDAFERYSLLE